MFERGGERVEKVLLKGHEKWGAEKGEFLNKFGMNKHSIE